MALALTIFVGLVLWYTGQVTLATLYLVFVSGLAAIYFLIKLMRNRQLIASFVTYAFLMLGMICAYAWVYYHNNMILGSDGEYESALYFSFVTWTTLGYGDLKPTESGRSLAASEAFIGYLFMGVLVALAYSIIERLQSNDDSDSTVQGQSGGIP
jgi:hypothetical protein